MKIEKLESFDFPDTMQEYSRGESIPVISQSNLNVIIKKINEIIPVINQLVLTSEKLFAINNVGEIQK